MRLAILAELHLGVAGAIDGALPDVHRATEMPAPTVDEFPGAVRERRPPSSIGLEEYGTGALVSPPRDSTVRVASNQNAALDALATRRLVGSWPGWAPPRGAPATSDAWNATTIASPQHWRAVEGPAREVRLSAGPPAGSGRSRSCLCLDCCFVPIDTGSGRDCGSP